MPRQPRLDVPDVAQHIIQRGNNRRPCFFDDGDYRALQSSLLLRPEQGPVIPGSGGLRKVRWGSQGKGKRGGAGDLLLVSRSGKNPVLPHL